MKFEINKNNHRVMGKDFERKATLDTDDFDN